MLQFAGHALEGTDPGEVIYFKRKLGLPYVEFPLSAQAAAKPFAREPSAGRGGPVAAPG